MKKTWLWKLLKTPRLKTLRVKKKTLEEVLNNYINHYMFVENGY